MKNFVFLHIPQYGNFFALQIWKNMLKSLLWKRVERVNIYF